jgi:hypothetical protein
VRPRLATRKHGRELGVLGRMRCSVGVAQLILRGFIVPFVMAKYAIYKKKRERCLTYHGDPVGAANSPWDSDPGADPTAVLVAVGDSRSCRRNGTF